MDEKLQQFIDSAYARGGFSKAGIGYDDFKNKILGSKEAFNTFAGGFSGKLGFDPDDLMTRYDRMNVANIAGDPAAMMDDLGIKPVGEMIRKATPTTPATFDRSAEAVRNFQTVQQPGQVESPTYLPSPEETVEQVKRPIETLGLSEQQMREQGIRPEAQPGLTVREFKPMRQEELEGMAMPLARPLAKGEQPKAGETIVRGAIGTQREGQKLALPENAFEDFAKNFVATYFEGGEVDLSQITPEEQTQIGVAFLRSFMSEEDFQKFLAENRFTEDDPNLLDRIQIIGRSGQKGLDDAIFGAMRLVGGMAVGGAQLATNAAIQNLNQTAFFADNPIQDVNLGDEVKAVNKTIDQWEKAVTMGGKRTLMDIAFETASGNGYNVFLPTAAKSAPVSMELATSAEGELLQGIGSSLPFLAASFLTGGTSAGAAAMGAAANAESQYDDLMDRTNGDATATQMLLSTGIGAIVGTTEALGVGSTLSRFKNLPKAINPANAFFKGVTKEAAEEFGQEWWTTFANNVSAKYIYDTGRDIMQGTGESALVGAGVGALFGFFAGAAHYKSYKDQFKSLKSMADSYAAMHIQSSYVDGELVDSGADTKGKLVGEIEGGAYFYIDKNPLTGKETHRPGVLKKNDDGSATFQSGPAVIKLNADEAASMLAPIQMDAVQAKIQFVSSSRFNRLDGKGNVVGRYEMSGKKLNKNGDVVGYYVTELGEDGKRGGQFLDMAEPSVIAISGARQKFEAEQLVTRQKADKIAAVSEQSREAAQGLELAQEITSLAVAPEAQPQAESVSQAISEPQKSREELVQDVESALAQVKASNKKVSTAKQLVTKAKKKNDPEAIAKAEEKLKDAELEAEVAKETHETAQKALNPQPVQNTQEPVPVEERVQQQPAAKSEAQPVTAEALSVPDVQGQEAAQTTQEQPVAPETTVPEESTPATAEQAAPATEVATQDGVEQQAAPVAEAKEQPSTESAKTPQAAVSDLMNAIRNPKEGVLLKPLLRRATAAYNALVSEYQALSKMGARTAAQSDRVKEIQELFETEDMKDFSDMLANNSEKIKQARIQAQAEGAEKRRGIFGKVAGFMKSAGVQGVFKDLLNTSSPDTVAAAMAREIMTSIESLRTTMLANASTEFNRNELAALIDPESDHSVHRMMELAGSPEGLLQLHAEVVDKIYNELLDRAQKGEFTTEELIEAGYDPKEFVGGRIEDAIGAMAMDITSISIFNPAYRERMIADEDFFFDTGGVDTSDTVMDVIDGTFSIEGGFPGQLALERSVPRLAADKLLPDVGLEPTTAYMTGKPISGPGGVGVSALQGAVPARSAPTASTFFKIENPGQANMRYPGYNDLMRKLSQMMGVRVTYGTGRGYAKLGQYNPQERSIRVPSVSHFGYFIHETGHHVDFYLNEGGKSVVSEITKLVPATPGAKPSVFANVDAEAELSAFAERYHGTKPADATSRVARSRAHEEGWSHFFYTYALNPDFAKQVAPALTKVLEDGMAANPKMAESIQAVVDAANIMVHMNQNGMGVDATMARYTSEPEAQKSLWKRLDDIKEIIKYGAFNFGKAAQYFMTNKAVAVVTEMRKAELAKGWIVKPTGDIEVRLPLYNGFGQRFQTQLETTGMVDANNNVIYDDQAEGFVANAKGEVGQLPKGTKVKSRITNSYLFAPIYDENPQVAEALERYLNRTMVLERMFEIYDVMSRELADGIADADKRLSDGKMTQAERDAAVNDLQSKYDAKVDSEVAIVYGGGIKRDGKTGIEQARKDYADMQEQMAAESARLAPGATYSFKERIDEATRRYRKFADETLRYAVMKGRMSNSTYNEIKKNNQYYVSFARIQARHPVFQEQTKNDAGIVTKTKISEYIGGAFDIDENTRLIDLPSPGSGNQGATAKATVMKRKGGGGLIEDPYVSLFMSATLIRRESDRNELVKMFVDTLRGTNAIEKIETSTNGFYRPSDVSLEGTVQIYETTGSGPNQTGSVKTYKVNDPLAAKFFKTMYGVERAGGNFGDFVVKPLVFLANIKRYFVTRGLPFIWRNVFRDTLSRMAISPNPTKFLEDYGRQDNIEVMVNGVPTDMKTAEVLALYGGAISFSDLKDRDSYYALVQEAVKKEKNISTVVSNVKDLKSAFQAAKDVFSLANERYTKIINRSEQINRLAEFKAAYRKVKDTPGWSEQDKLYYAAAASRGLMDFTVGGEAILAINRIVPFLNPTVQSLRIFARAASAEAKGDGLGYALSLMGSAANTVVKRSLQYHLIWAVAEILANLANDDDEMYRGLPSYRKDLFWNYRVGDGWIVVPKPYETAALVNMMTRMAKAAIYNDSSYINGREMRQYAFSMVFPIKVDETIGSLGGGAVSLLFNEDKFFNSTIIPEKDRDMKVAKRDTSRASVLGKVMQKASFDKIDARYIDYVVKSNFSYFGNFALKMSNTIGAAVDPEQSKLSRPINLAESATLKLWQPDNIWSNNDFDRAERFFEEEGLDPRFSRSAIPSMEDYYVKKMRAMGVSEDLSREQAVEMINKLRAEGKMVDELMTPSDLKDLRLDYMSAKTPEIKREIFRKFTTGSRELWDFIRQNEAQVVKDIDAQLGRTKEKRKQEQEERNARVNQK